MWVFLIDCKLNKANKKEPELLKVTEEWFKLNMPDLDYSCVFDIEGYYENDEWINETGTVAIGDLEFYNESGTSTLEEDSGEHEIAYLENQIENVKYYILLSELEDKDELDELGIESYRINDGSQFAYKRKTEYAKLDLVRFEKELSELRSVAA